MVGIDQTGQHDVPAQVEHFIGHGWEFRRGPNGFNKAVADEQPAVLDLAAFVIKGCYKGSVLDQ
jgi:hypothetical protein